MKVLIVGSGAREHTLAWRINQSPRLTRLWVAGGNAGTGRIASNVDVNPEDVEALVSTARSLSIDLVVVGPEIPLALGLVDRLTQLGIPAFGPTRAAARIEASKAFALDVMSEAGVPCPEFHVFNDEAAAYPSCKSVNSRGWSRPTGWLQERASVFATPPKRQRRRSATA